MNRKRLARTRGMCREQGGMARAPLQYGWGAHRRSKFGQGRAISESNAAVRFFRAREALRKRVGATRRTCVEHGCLDGTCGATAAHG